jgi:hypothetical protein
MGSGFSDEKGCADFVFVITKPPPIPHIGLVIASRA